MTAKTYPVFTDRRRVLTIWAALALLLSVFIVSASTLGIDPERIARGWAQLDRFFGRAFPPDVDTFWRLGPAVLDTIQIGIIGTFLGILMSLVLGALAAKNMAPSLVFSFVLKTLFGLTRAIPALVWALLFIVAVGLGPLPGILALAVNSIGMLGKIFAETFEEVDDGVIEALRSTGAGPVQIFTQGFVPETLPKLISWSIFRLDINIRYASILGIVGAGGIGWELSRAARMGDFQSAITVTLVIFVVVWAIEQISTGLRKLVL